VIHIASHHHVTPGRSRVADDAAPATEPGAHSTHFGCNLLLLLCCEIVLFAVWGVIAAAAPKSSVRGFVTASLQPAPWRRRFLSDLHDQTGFSALASINGGAMGGFVTICMVQMVRFVIRCLVIVFLLGQ
jgi:hypothetical protein